MHFRMHLGVILLELGRDLVSILGVLLEPAVQVLSCKLWDNCGESWATPLAKTRFLDGLASSKNTSVFPN